MILSLGEIMSQATALAKAQGYTSSEASLWANAAIQTVAQKIGHRPTQTIAVSSTTSGENRYSTPSDFDALEALTIYQGSSATTGSRGTQAFSLLARAPGWADQRSLPDSGFPENYVSFNGYLELYPSPNSAYSMQMRYFAKHPTLVQSTETVRLDDRWQLGCVFKAAEYLSGIKNDLEGEAMNRNRYLDYMSVVPNDRQLAQRDTRSMTIRFARNKPRDP